MLIPVVVRDKQGHPVAGLKQEDFQVYDNDKPRPISAFNVEQRGSTGNAQTNPSSPANIPRPADRAVIPALHHLSLR